MLRVFLHHYPPYYLFLFCVSECSACIYVCITTVCLVPNEVRRGSQSPLELELWIVLSHIVGAGNSTEVLCKDNRSP